MTTESDVPNFARRFLDMVRIDSQSGDEAAFIDYLATMYRTELGAECMLDGYGNLIARLAGRNSSVQEPILLCGHADTIAPSVGIRPRIEGGVIKSSGDTVLGADNKAGLAETFEAIATAEKHPPLEVLITRQEESGFHGAKNLDPKNFRSRIGFVVDIQALDSIIIGAPTLYYFDIDILGRSAHAGLRPEQGISAIRAAAGAIARIPNGRIDAETTVNVGKIRGGEARNAVPASVSLLAECRSLSHEKAEGLSRDIVKVFEEEASLLGATADIRVEMQLRAYSLPLDAPVIDFARKALVGNGITPNVFVSTAGNDAVFLNSIGIQTVVIGFGGKGAHTVDESIDIEDMRTAIGSIRNILELMA